MSDKIRIGIPQALLYYQYLPMWKTFFEELGAEIVTSSPTTKVMVGYGCDRVMGDVCLPVKVFCGHTHSLINACDYVFIPSVHSLVPNVYNCPKLIGLPDLVRANIPECPPILDPDIDVNKGRRCLYMSVYKAARPLSRNPLKTRNAFVKAMKVHKAFSMEMQRKGLTPPQAIGELPGECRVGDGKDECTFDITIALIGHPYMIYDKYVNHDLVHRLQKTGARVVFSSMIAKEELQSAMKKIVEQAYWDYEEGIVGAGGYYLESEVEGIISVVAFGCGPDSMMMELLRRRAVKLNKPFLPIVLDEHTTAGSLITRTEAFIDMVRRSKKSLPGQFCCNHLNKKQRDGVRILGVPNMANVAPAFRASLEMLGVSLVNPPVTKRTIALGVKYSPEFACLPFKGILGTFIESLEMGADSLFMVTSSNACRMGYYSRVQEQILRDLGYEFNFLMATEKDNGLTGVLKTVKRFANNASWPAVIAAYRLGIAKLKALDDLERKVGRIRAVELVKGQADYIFQEAMRAIDDASNISSVVQVTQRYNKRLDQIPKKLDFVPLRVGIIGAFYVRIEPFVNKNLEIKLGRFGVEVKRTKTAVLSEWTKPATYLNVLNKENRKLQKFARPYLKRDIGGYGLESVGEKIRAGQGGYDGLIHIAPLTCMPEAIARNVMINTREDIPVLSILCDEHMGEAGMTTRLEAFIDLMEQRRRQKSFAD